MTIEDILSETGGFGRFQLFVLLGVGMTRLTVGWSMVQMSYDGIVPEWFCLDTNKTRPDNGSYRACYANRSGQDGPCGDIHFVGVATTVVSEWDLVCSLDWVGSAITSIQMSGVVLGAVLAGQAGDTLGRKKVLYLFVLEHAVVNMITAFSVTWSMYAAGRFFIGAGIGGVLVSSFPYQLEFLPLKWRALVSALPIWSLGICVFALASWLMEDWSNLHIACGVLSLPALVGYFLVPESIRWLAVHGQMIEAQEVVIKMALTNHKLQPRKASITLQAVAWEEQKVHSGNKLYTYPDVFRDWSTTKPALIFCFHWFTLGLVYYGLSFSASGLSGNIHLIIFLLAVVEVPARLSTFYLSNKIGRKVTSVVSLALTCASLVAALIVQITAPDTTKKTVITALCVLAKLGIAAGWAASETWCSEFYPTVTRCLGLGTVNAAAATAAMIVPFLKDQEHMAVALFIVMISLLLVDMAVCSLAPETRGLELVDTPNHLLAAREPDKSNNAAVTREHENVDCVDNTIMEEKESGNVDETVLDGIGEEISDNDWNEENDLDKVHEIQITINDDTSTENPDRKRDKTECHRHDLQVEKADIHRGSKTPSPRASPLPSLKLQQVSPLPIMQRSSKQSSPKMKRVSPIQSPKLPQRSPNSSPKLSRTSPDPSPKLSHESPDPSPKSSHESPQPSPKSSHESPHPSPKKRRLEKLKNSEFLHVKTKVKPPADSPPYIESTHNKNIRFSIY